MRIKKKEIEGLKREVKAITGRNIKDKEEISRQEND